MGPNLQNKFDPEATLISLTNRKTLVAEGPIALMTISCEEF